MFGNSDEKGNCTIVQISKSFTNLLGYQKNDIIGKSLDIILPNFLIEDHYKHLEENICLLHNGLNEQKIYHLKKMN